MRANIAGFKDAWRNHVAHARHKYEDAEAVAIYQHVGALMKQLAAGAPPRKVQP
jgi:hypothetical protein